MNVDERGLQRATSARVSVKVPRVGRVRFAMGSSSLLTRV
jgi:hypothetical protein